MPPFLSNVKNEMRKRVAWTTPNCPRTFNALNNQLLNVSYESFADCYCPADALDLARFRDFRIAIRRNNSFGMPEGRWKGGAHRI